jgi:glutathione peroxidase
MGLFASVFATINRFRYRQTEPVGGSVYDFQMKSLSGELIDFQRYKGKKMLIVNTASKCVYTPQLDGLQKLHEQYGESVHVLGFPANDFLWQEPGSSSDIESFCQINYGVSFQMFEKIPVTGKRSHALFKWLASRSGTLPTWNFCKYLVDENGKDVLFFNSKVNPLDIQLTEKIIGQH